MSIKKGVSAAASTALEEFARAIPAQVRNWLRAVFRDVNDKVSTRVSTIPTAHEPTLDMAFVDSLNGRAYPASVPGGWTIRLDTHYLGGMRHWRNWEIADIGVLIMFRKNGKLIGSKTALLQSKRLYPQEQEFEEDEPEDYGIGFARLYKDAIGSAALQSRKFTLSVASKYKALLVDDEQYKAITTYEGQMRVPVFYLLYNPWVLPWSVVLPLTGKPKKPPRKDVGARILPAARMRAALAGQQAGYAPTYNDLVKNAPPEFQGVHTAGWRLEHFVVDRLLACKKDTETPTCRSIRGWNRSSTAAAGRSRPRFRSRSTLGMRTFAAPTNPKKERSQPETAIVRGSIELDVDGRNRAAERKLASKIAGKIGHISEARRAFFRCSRSNAFNDLIERSRS